MGSGGGGRDVDWLNHGRGFISAYLERRRIRREVLEATEEELKRRGVPVPARPLSMSKRLLPAARIIVIVIFCLVLCREMGIF